jgi:hypothetical protein
MSIKEQSRSSQLPEHFSGLSAAEIDRPPISDAPSGFPTASGRDHR